MKKKQSSRKKAKALPPTKAASGEGFTIEDKIGAICAASLLTGRSPFAGLPGQLIRVDFQVAADHWQFNDLLLTMEDTAGYYRAAVSIRSKREIRSSGFQIDTKNSLVVQFTKEAPNPFDRKNDRLVLVAAPHAEMVTQAVHALTMAARGNPEQLPTRIKEPGFANATARTLYDDLQSHLDAKSVTAADVFHSLVLEELDMDALARTPPSAGLTLCHDLLSDPDSGSTLALWEALVSAAQKQKHATGYLDVPRVLAEIRSRFNLKAYPHDAGDWTKINSVSRGLMDYVTDQIAGHRLPRQKELQVIQTSIESNTVTAVFGPSGCGKSSLAKHLTEATAGTYHLQVWTRVQSWKRPAPGSLSEGLGLPLLNHDLSALFERISGPSLLVVDGVENCTDTELIRRLVRLLRLCRPGDPDSPWRVVLLARAEEWGGVREQLALEAPDIKIHPEPLADFTIGDLREISAIIPELGPLVRQPHLVNLMRKPKILELITKHIRSSGVIDPRDLTGESHLARWFWRDRVHRGDHALLRVRAARALAEKQAEMIQSEIRQDDFEATLLPAFSELVTEGVCVFRNERFAFQHDLYADWARLETLIGEASNWISFATDRIGSPHWHRAVRLFGVWLLEQVENGSTQWATQVAHLSAGDTSSRVIADLLLEAPVFSAASVDNLERVWPHLSEGNGQLLRRMLRRLRLSASMPDESMIGWFNEQGSFTKDFLEAHFRVPVPQYWLPLLQVLDHHRADGIKLAPIEVALTAESWLKVSELGWPAREQAAELAVSNAESRQAATAKDSSLAEIETDKMIYQAAIVAIVDLPARVSVLLRKLAGLLPRDGSKSFPTKRWIIRKVGFHPGPGIKYELPPPWPGGPWCDPDRALPHLVLQTAALAPVTRVNPGLARELSLSVCIDPPEIEDSFSSCHSDPSGVTIDDSFQPPFYTRGPFLKLLQSCPTEGMALILDLTNFFTERWLDWIKNDRNRQAPSVIIDGNAGPEIWLGDHRLYFAHRNAVTCNVFVVSALMALEKWLTDRIESGESIDSEVETLLSGSKSLAIAGLLITIGKRQPNLLFGPLWPLASSPDVHDFECHCTGAIAGAFAGLHTNEVARKLIGEWNSLPQHHIKLYEACGQCIPHPLASSKLSALSKQWKELLKTPESLSVNFRFLWELSEFFEPENWKKEPVEGSIEWHYEVPFELTEATRALREKSQGEALLITIPMDCRSLLDNEADLSDQDLESWFAALDQLPLGPIFDSDGNSTIGSLADAQCAIIAVLVRLGSDWLRRSPEKIIRCREIVLQHMRHPPAPRRFMYAATPFNHTWENFCADVAPVFLADDPANTDWRRVVGELAGRRYLQTIRNLFWSSSAVRAQLGVAFVQLFDLLIWVAAARQMMDFTDHEMEESAQWKTWWAPRLESYISSTLDSPPTDWEAITLGMPTMVPRERRCSWPNLDIGVVVAGLGWLQSFTQAADANERERWFGWMKSLMASLLVGIPERVNNQDRSPLPDEGGHLALMILGRLLTTLPDRSERRQLWEPLFSLGKPAACYIKYFLHAFFESGLKSDNRIFAATWKEMAGWAWEHPGWHGQSAHPPYEVREMWFALLLLDDSAQDLTPAHTSLIGDMRLHYQKWADLNLADSSSATRLIHLLRNPAAEPILTLGLGWLDRSIDHDLKQRWRLRDLLTHLSDFLVWAWSHHEATVRADPAAFAAYKRILILLAAEQDQPALAHLHKVTGAGLV